MSQLLNPNNVLLKFIIDYNSLYIINLQNLYIFIKNQCIETVMIFTGCTVVKIALNPHKNDFLHIQ